MYGSVDFCRGTMLFITTNSRTFSQPTEETLDQRAATPILSYPSTWQPRIYFLPLWFCLFWTLHTNGIIQYVLFGLDLLSFFLSLSNSLFHLLSLFLLLSSRCPLLFLVPPLAGCLGAPGRAGSSYRAGELSLGACPAGTKYLDTLGRGQSLAQQDWAETWVVGLRPVAWSTRTTDPDTQRRREVKGWRAS